uniref:Uncharacterized protein n=1 Tax=Arundo donax TaxID=35708 RepID=A0A0A8ZS96_ARUDO
MAPISYPLWALLLWRPKVASTYTILAL